MSYFTAHKAGKADVKLFIDGKKITKKPVHYSSMTRFAYTCPEYLCQLLGLNDENKAGLDKELTNIFNNSSPQDGSLHYLLTPKNLQATSTGGKSLKCFIVCQIHPIVCMLTVSCCLYSSYMKRYS